MEAHSDEQLGYPAGHVLAISGSGTEMREAIAALEGAGCAPGDIQSLNRPSDAHHLDAAAGNRGFFGRLAAGAINLGDDTSDNVTRYREALTKGGTIVAAAATDDRARPLAQILAAHGGSFIFHYGRFTIERLS